MHNKKPRSGDVSPTRCVAPDPAMAQALSLAFAAHFAQGFASATPAAAFLQHSVFSQATQVFPAFVFFAVALQQSPAQAAGPAVNATATTARLIHRIDFVIIYFFRFVLLLVPRTFRGAESVLFTGGPAGWLRTHC